MKYLSAAFVCFLFVATGTLSASVTISILVSNSSTGTITVTGSDTATGFAGYARWEAAVTTPGIVRLAIEGGPVEMSFDGNVADRSVQTSGLDNPSYVYFDGTVEPGYAVAATANSNYSYNSINLESFIGNSYIIPGTNNGGTGTMADDLTINVVPEPAHVAIGLAAGGLLFAMLRRRR